MYNVQRSKSGGSMNESPMCFMIVSLISQQKRYKSLNYVNNCTFAGGKEYKADMTSSHDIWQWQEPRKAQRKAGTMDAG